MFCSEKCMCVELVTNKKVQKKRVKSRIASNKKKLSHDPLCFSGKNNHNWKGGEVFHAKGYVYATAPTNHPHTHNNYVLKHRLVMENFIGRYLLPNEIVHHKDGDKANNKISNLVLCSGHKEHSDLHKEIHLTHDMRDYIKEHYCKEDEASIRKFAGLDKWSMIRFVRKHILNE